MNVLVNEQSLRDIANAIREKNGTEDTYKPSQMGDAVRGIQSGGEDLFKHARSLSGFFRNATFTDGYELNVYVPNIGMIEGGSSQRDISYAFRETKGLKKIILKCDATEISIASSYAFNKSDVEEVDLSAFYPIFANLGATFGSSTKLKTIRGQLDLSAIKTGNLSSFSSCTSLVDLELKKNTLFVSFGIAQSPLLSDESIQSIIDGLADLTGGTAQTITFHKDVKAKLTDDQIAQITSKNWTLA